MKARSLKLTPKQLLKRREIVLDEARRLDDDQLERIDALEDELEGIIPDSVWWLRGQIENESHPEGQLALFEKMAAMLPDGGLKERQRAFGELLRQSLAVGSLVQITIH
jgi:hypothetical protein